MEFGLKVAAEALAQRAAASAKSPTAARATTSSGRRIRVPVHRGGEVVGTAEATLNLERTLPAVLALARREQGEIPFAVDRDGAMHTTDPADEAVLDGIDAARLAARAVTGAPQRVDDWIVVARQEPTGIIFGIARPIGESLKERRRAPFRGTAEPFDDAPLMALKLNA